MKEYHNCIKYILENGQDVSDRTGVGTRSIFGYQMRFDLQKGFPAVTTKKLAWKAVVGELLWFLHGSSDERKLAELTYGKNREELIGKNTIWSANSENQGMCLGYPNNNIIAPLGPVYGYNWRKIKSTCSDIKKIPKRMVDDRYKKIRKTPMITPTTCSDDPLVGKIFRNIEKREFVVYDRFYEKRNLMYNIQFKDIGSKFIIKDTSLKGDNSIHHKLKYNIGHYDVNSLDGNKIMKRLYKVWDHMLSRCYNISDINYKNYGGKGIFVCEKWHRFSDFISDVVNLPGFYEWVFNPEYQLDKDFYCSDGYAPNTCVFLHKNDNVCIKKTATAYDFKTVVTFEDGNTFEYICFNELNTEYPEYNFRPDKIARCIRNPSYKHKNCSFHTIREDGFTFRRELYIDQISSIINEIKQNPTSRRLILTSLDVGSVDKASLPPCHILFQFKVYNGRLSCQLYQRSADIGLGVPFNIASYALLTHIIARECGLQVGDFVHTIGDAHIYNDHIEPLKEMLLRTPYDLPTLEIDKSFNLKDGLDFGFGIDSIDMFTLKNYQSHATIKMNMAV